MVYFPHNDVGLIQIRFLVKKSIIPNKQARGNVFDWSTRTLCCWDFGLVSLTLNFKLFDWIIPHLKVTLDKSACQINKWKCRLNGKTAVYGQHVEIEYQSKGDQPRFYFETSRLYLALLPLEEKRQPYFRSCFSHLQNNCNLLGCSENRKTLGFGIHVPNNSF